MSGYPLYPLSKKRRHSMGALVFSLCLLLAPSVFAGQGAAYLVSPSEPDAIAYKPLYLSVLTSTELGLSPPLAGSIAQTPAVGRFTIGSDNYLSGKVRIFDLPVTAAIYPDLYVQLNLPWVSRDVKTASGTSSKSGLGDIDLSLKLRMDLGESTETYYLLDARLPTGDKDQGLGSGSYDISVAQKLVTWFGAYRSTFMAGVTAPLSHVTVVDSTVKLSPTVSYMAAAERSLLKPNLWFGIKMAGEHVFNSRLDGVYQPNGLTTVDVIPETTYYLANGLRLRGALLLPVYTSYVLPGAENSRGVVVNLGVSKTF